MGCKLNGVSMEVLIKQGHLEIHTSYFHAGRAKHFYILTLGVQTSWSGYHMQQWDGEEMCLGNVLILGGLGGV